MIVRYYSRVDQAVHDPYQWYGSENLLTDIDQYPLDGDGDDDGVSDGHMGMYLGPNPLTIASLKISNRDGVVTVIGIPVETYSLDTDGDGLVNALDNNSDNDAFTDGQEVSDRYVDGINPVDYRMNTNMLDRFSPYVYTYDDMLSSFTDAKKGAFEQDIYKLDTGDHSLWVDYSDIYNTSSGDSRIFGLFTDGKDNEYFQPSSIKDYFHTNITKSYIDNGDKTFDPWDDYLVGDEIEYTSFSIVPNYSYGGKLIDLLTFEQNLKPILNLDNSIMLQSLGLRCEIGTGLENTTSTTGQVMFDKEDITVNVRDDLGHSTSIPLSATATIVIDYVDPDGPTVGEIIDNAINSTLYVKGTAGDQDWFIGITSIQVTQSNGAYYTHASEYGGHFSGSNAPYPMMNTGDHIYKAEITDGGNFYKSDYVVFFLTIFLTNYQNFNFLRRFPMTSFVK